MNVIKDKIIEAENLTKIYKKSVKAVDNISFSVEEGELGSVKSPFGNLCCENSFGGV